MGTGKQEGDKAGFTKAHAAWYPVGPNQYRRAGAERVYSETEYLDILVQEQQGLKHGQWYTVSEGRYRKVGYPNSYNEQEYRYLAACDNFWGLVGMLAFAIVVLAVFLYFDWWTSNLWLLYVLIPLGAVRLLWDLGQVLRWKKWGR